MNKLQNWTVFAHKLAIFLLKVAAVAVAAPRYIGTFGMAAGLDLGTTMAWLPAVEAYSGGAMALLEGFAMAFVLARWRMLKPGTGQWKTLLVFWVVLALAMPLTAAPYLLATQKGISIDAFFTETTTFWQLPWAFLVAAVPILVIMAVGFADVDEAEREAAAINQRAEIKQSRAAARAKADAAAKPFECQQCGRSFASQSGLNAHARFCKSDNRADGEQNGKLAKQMANVNGEDGER